MPGARLDYDNAAFYHFFIAVLFIFLAPFSYYVLQRIVSFLILRGKKYEMKAKARTQEEQEKFEKSRWRRGSAARCLPKDFCVLLQ